MIIQIKQYTGHVLFEYEQTGEVTLRDALEKGVQSETNLHGAYLYGAYLPGAILSRAILSRADLRGADLRGADLRGAILSGADLRGADLSGADLFRADLREVDLHGASLQYGVELIRDRPLFTVGPIGSRSDFMQAWLTDKGVLIQAGCFLGTQAEFIKKLAETHSDNIHAKEYLAALVLIDKHAELWTQRS